MANPTGELKVKARGKTYRLHLGMSNLAALQDEFGDKLDAILAPADDGKLPNLRVMHAIFMEALQRHHGDEADRWLVDDIIAENANAFGELLSAAFPSPQEDASEGNGKAAA